MWNWHTASIDLLLEIQTKDNSRWKKIEPYLDLHAERSKGNMIWSTALGISPDDKVPFRTAGEMLEQRPDILNHIHGLLGIRERFVFQPGKDFKAQLDQAKQLSEQQTKTVDESDPDLLEEPVEESDNAS
jgi:hypothetical protein